MLAIDAMPNAMSGRTLRNWLSALTVLAVTPASVSADPYSAERSDPGYAPERSESVWFDPAVRSGIGVGVQAGAGVVGFTDAAMRDTTGTLGGMWSLRGAFGTRVPVALELGYAGSATTIDTELGRADATMLGTTVEAAARYNFMPRADWSPYMFAGLGWQRYTIDDTAFQLSDVGIGNEDDLLVVPLGLGVGWRAGGLVADLRGTFRAASGADLVLETPELSLATGAGQFASMHTWDASLNVGYEF